MPDPTPQPKPAPQTSVAHSLAASALAERAPSLLEALKDRLLSMKRPEATLICAGSPFAAEVGELYGDGTVLAMPFVDAIRGCDGKPRLAVQILFDIPNDNPCSCRYSIPSNDLFVALRVLHAIPHLRQLSGDALQACIQSVDPKVQTAEQAEARKSLHHSSDAMGRLFGTLGDIDAPLSAARRANLTIHPADIARELRSGGVKSTPLLESFAYDHLIGERLPNPPYNQYINAVSDGKLSWALNRANLWLMGSRCTSAMNYYVDCACKLPVTELNRQIEDFSHQNVKELVTALGRLCRSVCKPARREMAAFIEVVKSVRECQRAYIKALRETARETRMHRHDPEVEVYSRHENIWQSYQVFNRMIRTAFCDIYEPSPSRFSSL